jgi:GntR family transcriptional regulator
MDSRRLVRRASGDPIMASVLVVPGSRHEIEDTYALS